MRIIRGNAILRVGARSATHIGLFDVTGLRDSTIYARFHRIPWSYIKSDVTALIALSRGVNATAISAPVVLIIGM